ncbi:MAG TPA: lysylphosphatidylglycerol synthase transmembrane domain-containing protein [Mobilitalea sp.]|nr:lysylphosphatidylglycerol synthase transmembrane domain-containing protein [Mobilitalea sp.]
MKTNVVSKKNQIRSILFILLLMVITIVVIFKEYSFGEIIRVIKSVHPFYLIAGIMMMFFCVLCQAMNFSVIIKKLGHSANYGYCIEYAYVGNYFGAITPGASGGQPAQLYYMNKDNIHVDISAITVFFMVFVSQIVILFIGGLLALLGYPMIEGYKNWLKYLMLAGAIVMLGLTLILTALMFMKKTVPFLFHIVMKAAVKVHLVKKPDEVQAKFDAMMLSYQEKSKLILKHPDLFVQVFVVTLLQWIAYYMVSYLVYLSFGYRDHSPIDIMTGQSMINIAVAAVPLPGSVGVAEKAYLNVFGQFYTAEQLPSAMILTRIINFYLPLFISFFVYLLLHFRIVKQKKQQNRKTL